MLIAIPCWPVIGCKMNDLEWPWVAISSFHVKIKIRFWPAKLSRAYPCVS